MRPLPGDDAFGRSRAHAHDNDSPSTFNLPAAPQMTYFFADESTIGSGASQQQPSPAALHHRPKDTGSRRAFAADHNNHHHHPKPRRTSNHSRDHDIDMGEEPGGSSSCGGSSSKRPSELSRDEAAEGGIPTPMTPPSKPSAAASNFSSRPMTPVLYGPSGPASTLSGISSRRNSLSESMSDDFGSHPPSLDGHGSDGEPSVSMMDSGSAPQLVMPSIKMPSRRPFTQEGKGMGRLKVLVAGDSGVGKTSLIKAIVQSCEHIVHVDPITPSPQAPVSPLPTRSMVRQNRGSGGGGNHRRSSRGDAAGPGTAQITEIYASTKPYPAWWSEADDVAVLRRHKSLGDAVLDRNICFVDTPGYGSGSSAMDTITPVAKYIEKHLRHMSSNSLSDGDMLNLLGGEGGIQVDVVFYMVSSRLRPVDIQYLRQLAPLTNIILLLAQTDLMSADQVASSKEQISCQLREAAVRPFSFSIVPSQSTSPSPNSSANQGLYAISSAAGSDHDIMDASLLMSPDYVHPLVSTELTTLVEEVFSQNGASWLRHSAARKYVQWRKNGSACPTSPSPEVPLATHQSHPLRTLETLGSSGPANSFNMQMSCSTSPSPQGQAVLAEGGAMPSYALARIADHTQREERLSQIRLANWAADLQTSLANERAQYAALVRGERAIWLTEKINECVQDGSLVPTSLPRSDERSTSRLRTQLKRRKTVSTATQSSGGLTERDPLGLLEVAAELQYKGLIALELLGSLSLLGGFALWVSKNYCHLQAYGWLTGEWERFWGSGR